MQFSKNKSNVILDCLRVFADLSKPNNVSLNTATAYGTSIHCQSVDLSDIRKLVSVYVSLERR